VITTGVFDGVHQGHLAIIDLVKQRADENGGESVIVTFWPHPRLVLKQDVSIKLINTIEEKLDRFEEHGIQHVVIIPFTDEFSRMSSHQFIEDIIIKNLRVNHLIIGFNHHFGKGREGNFDLVKDYANKYGFSLEKLDVQMVENEKVSSTLIRKALTSGDVDTANKYLGYDYSITGTVVEGKKIGRTIGFPTANISVNHDFKLIPALGVYAVEVIIDDKRFSGMLNIGYNPTIASDSGKITIEVNILNFSEEIYKKEITLLFKYRLRSEVKFQSLEHLKKQLEADRSEVIKLLGV
jgi:riboflavin kinase/FMN adenylyltransferase